MTKNKKISVEDKEITFILDNEKEYISLSEILKEFSLELNMCSRILYIRL